MNTQIDPNNANKWQKMEIEFETGENTDVILYLSGGTQIPKNDGTGTTYSAYRNCYLTNLKWEVVE